MSMARFTEPNRIPVLVADSLISAPDNASALATPDHPHGISNVFPPGSGFVPTRLARKTCIVNSGLAMAMVGSVVHMRAFREDALAHFRDQPECSGADVELFLQQYEADPDGRIVLENVDVFLLSSRPVGEGRHLYWLLTAGPNRRGGVEVKSENLGHVLATGSGAAGMKSAVGAVDTYALSGMVPTEEWNYSHDAIARNLTLIARMHKVDELTAQMLLKYWGGGYEVIYREAGNGLVYLKDYTILFWALDLEDRDSEIHPEGFIKYERREDFSVLTSHRQGVFAMKAIADVGVPGRSVTIKKPDREYLNSDMQMNVVCTVRGRRITNLYPLCYRYKRGESNPSKIILGDDGRVNIGLSAEFEPELRSFIRDRERREREVASEHAIPVSGGEERSSVRDIRQERATESALGRGRSRRGAP